MDLSDLPGVGAFATLGVVAVELLLHFGDLVAVLLFSNVDLVVSVLITLDRLADRVDWLPNSAIESLLLVALTALLVSYLIRLKRNTTDND